MDALNLEKGKGYLVWGRDLPIGRRYGVFQQTIKVDNVRYAIFHVNTSIIWGIQVCQIIGIERKD